MEYYRNGEVGFLEELVDMELYGINQEFNTNNLTLPFPPPPTNDCFFQDQTFFDYALFGDALSPPDFSSTLNLETQTLPCLQQAADSYCYSIVEDPWKAEPAYSVGVAVGPSIRKKKVNGGQPSKNLMAERRRRKRLNDRLSMLRSVVPKITKNIDTGRHNRLREGATAKGEQLATRNAFGAKSVELIQRCQTQ